MLASLSSVWAKCTKVVIFFEAQSESGARDYSNQLRPVNLARSEGLVLVLLNPVLKATRGTQGFLQLWGPQRVWIPSCDGGHI